MKKKKKKKVGCSSSSPAHNHSDQFCKGEIKETNVSFMVSVLIETPSNYSMWR